MGEVLLRHPQELQGQTAQLAGKAGQRAREIIGDPCTPQTLRSPALMHTVSTTPTEKQGFNEVFLHSSFRTRGRGGGKASFHALPEELFRQGLRKQNPAVSVQQELCFDGALTR